MTNDLPEGAKVTKTEITTLGRLTGTGTREVVLLPGPTAQRLECVLFFPKSTLKGCYIFTLFSGPSAGDAVEKEQGGILQSIREL